MIPPARASEIEQGELIAERREIASHSQRSGAGPDQSHPFAVALLPACGRRPHYIVLVVGGDTLQTTDRHRLLLDAPTPAGRLARPVARSARESPERRSMTN